LVKQKKKIKLEPKSPEFQAKLQMSHLADVTALREAILGSKLNSHAEFV